MTKQQYANIPAVDDILAEAEEILVESVGRFQAQRFIAIFAQLSGSNPREQRNFWVEIFQAGQKAGGK